ncbi:MAG: hypothetical protein ISS74_06350 [Planctomycetes bacterium]|nr:hypothetical protein [Planctomycetota bacterium]
MEALFGAAAGAVPCLAFGAFAAIAAVLIVFGIMKARQRRQEMLALAQKWGLAYYPDDPWGLPTWYGGLDLFNHGHSKKASNVLSGEVDGRTVVAFDYYYVTGSGKNRSTHHFQAVVYLLPIQAPRLRLRQENVLDRMASWVGWDDIDFESDEFSRRYHVASDDRRFAYDIFHARLIDYLLQCRQTPNMEMSGVFLIVYDSGSGQVANFERLLAIGQTVVAMIPDYVLKARGVEQTGASAPGGTR